MTYVIGRGGKVMFRADWTDAPTIVHAINYVLNSRVRRREELRLALFSAKIPSWFPSFGLLIASDPHR